MNAGFWATHQGYQGRGCGSQRNGGLALALSSGERLSQVNDVAAPMAFVTLDPAVPGPSTRSVAKAAMEGMKGEATRTGARRGRHSWPVAVLILLLGMAGCGQATSIWAGEAVRVEIKGFAFVPSEITVNAGDAVTWINRDSASHTLSGKDWDSGVLARGATFSRTFDSSGTYTYECEFHPSMVGRVVVK